MTMQATTVRPYQEVPVQIGNTPNGQPTTIIIRTEQPRGYERDSYHGEESTKKKGFFNKVGSILPQLAVGGFLGFQAASSLGDGVESFSSGWTDASVGGGFEDVGMFDGFLGGALGTVVKGAGIGAAVCGGFSAVSNIMAAIKGDIGKGRALGNVIGDTFSGAVSGIMGAGAAHLGLSLMSSFGLAGIPAMIGGVALGALGSVVGGKLTSGIRNKISDSIANMIDKPKPQPVE